MNRETETFVGHHAVVELLKMMVEPALVEKFLASIPQEDKIEVPVLTNSFGKILEREAESVLDELIREMYSFCLTSPEIKRLEDVTKSDKKNLVYVMRRELDRLLTAYNPK